MTSRHAQEIAANLAHVSQRDAKKAIEAAERFLYAAKRLLPGESNLPDEDSPVS